MIGNGEPACSGGYIYLPSLNTSIELNWPIRRAMGGGATPWLGVRALGRRMGADPSWVGTRAPVRDRRLALRHARKQRGAGPILGIAGTSFKRALTAGAGTISAPLGCRPKCLGERAPESRAWTPLLRKHQGLRQAFQRRWTQRTATDRSASSPASIRRTRCASNKSWSSR